MRDDMARSRCMSATYEGITATDALQICLITIFVTYVVISMCQCEAVVFANVLFAKTTGWKSIRTATWTSAMVCWIVPVVLIFPAVIQHWEYWQFVRNETRTLTNTETNVFASKATAIGTASALSEAVLILGPLYANKSGIEDSRGQQNKVDTSFMFGLRVM